MGRISGRTTRPRRVCLQRRFIHTCRLKVERFVVFGVVAVSRSPDMFPLFSQRAANGIGTNTLVNTTSNGASGAKGSGTSSTSSKPVSAAAGIASLVPSKGAPVATARPSLKPGEYPPTAELQVSWFDTAVFQVSRLLRVAFSQDRHVNILTRQMVRFSQARGAMTPERNALCTTGTLPRQPPQSFYVGFPLIGR